MSLISKYLYGWDTLEPALLSCVALNQNVLLIGKHGIGKSAFMRFLGHAMSRGKKDFNVVKYAMDKENLISMVGIPNATALSEGRIDYAQHERSIFKADVALFDEITRAGKENQNMVLEIFEEGTVFGKELDRLKLRVATANDDTYKGAMKLDAALLDRFYVVLPIPDAGTDQARFGPEELEKIIRLNLGDREKNLEDSDKDLAETLDNIRKTYEELWLKLDKDGKTVIRDNVIEFAAKFVSQVLTNAAEKNKGKKSDKFYLSLRQIGDQFPRLIMAIASYFKVVKDDPEYLKSGAWEAIKYSFSTKLCFEHQKLKEIFSGLADLLTDGDALVGKVKIGLTTGSVSSRIKMLEDYPEVIRDNMELDETINAIGNILQDIDISYEDSSRNANENADPNMRELLRLTQLLEDNNLPEVCILKAKMKMWHYACEPKRKLLHRVVAWDIAA